MSPSRSSKSRPFPCVTPTPQHIRLSGKVGPLGPLVLTGAKDVDAWALTVLKRGINRLGLPEPRRTAPTGPHTALTLTTSREACSELLARCRSEFGQGCTLSRLTHEGYLLDVRRERNTNRVTIAATGDAGLAYGVDTFLQLIDPADGTAHLREALVFDYPAVAIRVYGGTADLDEAATRRFNMRGGGGTIEQITEMRLRHIEPWTTIHPSHASAGHPGLQYSDGQAVERAINPIVEAAERGVNWVGMNFDDIDLRLPHPEDVENYGTIGKAQAAFINHTLKRVRKANSEAILTVIPIIYANNWVPGTWVYAVDEEENRDYLETLGREVDPSVVFVWTGESVESSSMADDDIKEWVDLVRRKPIVFENTPTGDLTDFGPLRHRTDNAGELLLGWIYIHRGPQAMIAELSTAEYLWNPKAYDPDAALSRALTRLVGDKAAPEMGKLIAAFSAGTDRANNPRYRHPLWREGRLLEIAEPDDEAVAAFYRERSQVIAAAVPALDELIRDNLFYEAVRNIALSSLDVAEAYLETSTMLRCAQRGEIDKALKAGDRAEALFEGWNRSSSGSTTLEAANDRRDAMTYIEQTGVAGRLRRMRRGDEGPIPWVLTAGQRTRFGRRCAVLSSRGSSVVLKIRATHASPKWLVLTACGEPNPPIRLEVNTVEVPLPMDAWRPDRWQSVAVPLHPARRRRTMTQFSVAVTATSACDWALHRGAILEEPAAVRLLHAVRSSAAVGQAARLGEPTRHLCCVSMPHLSGRVAVRADIEIRRGVSGQFLRLRSGDIVGQTFHLPAEGDYPVPPKDPIRLIVRESSDGDFLASIAIMFQQHGLKPLALALWRWAGSPTRTTSDMGNRIATALGKPGTPFGPSRHWIEFPLGAELDPDSTYYIELSAPEGWEGWRLRQSYGWYGRRSDPTRSAYLNGEMLKGADVPLTTYVWDAYDADWTA